MQGLDLFPLKVMFLIFRAFDKNLTFLLRSECLVLSSCEERSQPGVVSGYKGCSLEPSKLSLYNRCVPVVGML